MSTASCDTLVPVQGVGFLSPCAEARLSTRFQVNIFTSNVVQVLGNWVTVLQLCLLMSPAQTCKIIVMLDNQCLPMLSSTQKRCHQNFKNLLKIFGNQVYENKLSPPEIGTPVYNIIKHRLYVWSQCHTVPGWAGGGDL